MYVRISRVRAQPRFFAALSAGAEHQKNGIRVSVTLTPRANA
jgi:hypothetical protein